QDKSRESAPTRCLRSSEQEVPLRALVPWRQADYSKSGNSRCCPYEASVVLASPESKCRVDCLSPDIQQPSILKFALPYEDRSILPLPQYSAGWTYVSFIRSGKSAILAPVNLSNRVSRNLHEAARSQASLSIEAR